MKIIDNRTDEHTVCFNDIPVGNIFEFDGLYFIKIKDCEDAREPLQWFNAFELTREPQKNDDGLWCMARADKVKPINGHIVFENIETFE